MTAQEEKTEAEENTKDGTVEAQANGVEASGESGKMTQESQFQEERDAIEDKREKISRSDVFWSKDYASCNALQSSDGRLLLSMCDAGFQYLLAGTRCSVGVKSGRYFFEVKMVEMLNPAEAQRPTVRTPLPRQLLRLGVSLRPQTSLLVDSSDAAFFDSEGFFVCGSTRVRASFPIGRDQVVGCLINMDPASTNAHTISLFRDGIRISDPQPLPESLVGKVLYPCITWRNVTLQTNFGPAPKKALPFTCRMLNDAAVADLEVMQETKRDKNEVVFPVGLPEQGLFDWLDAFLQEKRQYVELSDRQVVQWATSSGVQCQTGQIGASSIDKPLMGFGIPLLDDMSVQKTLASVAPTMKRDLVLMELKSNLMAADRKERLAKFPSSRFKKIAIVAMGEPSTDFKAVVHERMLADKHKDLGIEYKNENGHDSKRRKVDGEPDSEKQESEKAEEGEAKPIELTDEEQKAWYYKRDTPDISQEVLSKYFTSFSLPTEEEGFDEIKYVWQSEDACRAHMRAWMLELKKTLKAEHLEPSTWFTEKYAEWSKLLTEWRRKQNDLKQKRKEAAAGKKEDTEGGDGVAMADAEIKRQRDMDEAFDTETVENIDDIGNGRPLFAHFEYEDWVLLGLRFEFHLMIHAFRKDLDDPDRPGFPEAHMLFYYNKYFKKNLNLSLYKLKELLDLIELVKDSIVIDAESGLMQSTLSVDEPFDKFIRLTEECRRERQRCIDAGDETATLEFSKPPPSAPPPSKGDDKGSNMASRYSDRPPPVSGLRRPVLHGSVTRGVSSYSQGGAGKGDVPSRSSYPPSRGSYGAPPPSQKRPMPPATVPYGSKQPRYGSGSGPGVGGGSRSAYPPSHGTRSYH